VNNFIDDEPMGSDQLKADISVADGEVYRLYLGPMFTPDKLGSDQLWYRY
jgi:hypothetical protein